MTEPLKAAVDALRKELRLFISEELRQGSFRPSCNSWLDGYSVEFSRKLGERGWLGMTWPRRYGGQDRSSVERFVVMEELLAAGAPVAAHWIADRQTGPMLLRYGTESQKQRFLPRIAAGELYFAIGMSEPDAGSDLASIRTRAKRYSEGWKVTGTKVWTSHADRSHYLATLVRTAPPSSDRHAGLTQMIIALNSEGVEVRPIEAMTGESHFNEVVLLDVFVPDEMVIGEPGEGWGQIILELSHERSGPERFLSTLPLVVSWLNNHGPHEANTEEDLGRIAAQLWALRSLSLEVNASIADGTATVEDPALLKVLGTTFERDVIEIVRSATEGQKRSHDFDRLFSEALLASPSFTLRGGTTEILRTVIGRSLAS